MLEFSPKTTLAAIVYEAGAGGLTDQTLWSIADARFDQGYRLAGTVQRAIERSDRCACDMIVRDLASDLEVKISEDRGVHAQGCRLDPQALEALVGSTMSAIDCGIDLLIINKFGKQESVGAGFRDAIGRAVSEGVPTLVAVNITYIESWQAFATGFADSLAPNKAAVESWLVSRLPVSSGLPATRQRPAAARR